MTQERIHFVGIGGAGMSAIARMLLALGRRVSGSDIADSDVTRLLQSLGADIVIGHHSDNVVGAKLVVRSTAIEDDNAEVIEARRRHIPVIHRSEMLARLMDDKRGIAIAGSHGKTTITSLLSWALVEAGYDPSFVIGGQIAEYGGGRAGSGSFLVAEADESDGSFLRYRPLVAVLTSVEPDHLEHWQGDFNNLIHAYSMFLENVKSDGFVVLCRDSAGAWTLKDRLGVPVVSYGLKEGDYGAECIERGRETTTFYVLHRGQNLGKVTLVIPGLHNVQNALAVIAVCNELNLDLTRIFPTLATFTGAKRRFDTIGTVNGAVVIDDYAHHPSEIAATLNAARDRAQGRVIAVFQPHRYNRTKYLFEDFKRVFADADEVILTDIYAPPPEKPIPGVSSQRLAMEISALSKKPVRFFSDMSDIVNTLRAEATAGDMILVMGAGDIWKVTRSLIERNGVPHPRE